MSLYYFFIGSSSSANIKENGSLSCKSRQMRQVSTTTNSLFSMIRSAEMVSSLMMTSSKISMSPRFLERYWQIADGVIPSFSAASFWLSPNRLIIRSASSFRIAGIPFQSMYSQGVFRIEAKYLFSINN